MTPPSVSIDPQTEVHSQGVGIPITMNWWHDLYGAFRELPRFQKVLLLGLASILLGASSVPFFQIGQFSMLRGSDSTGYYIWLRSAMVDGDWDFANDIALCNTLSDEYRAAWTQLPATETGRCPNKYSIGWAAISVPFYLTADGIVEAGNALGLWQWERDGFNPIYQICLQLGHLLLGLTGLILAWRCVQHWCGDRMVALWAVVLILLGSPLIYYMALKPSMAHNAAFFAIALMTWGCLKVEEFPTRVWPWVVAGAGWGLATTLRFNLAVFGLLPAVAWLLRIRSGQTLLGAFRTALGWLAGALPLLLLQSYAWHVVYGHWLVFTYGEGGEGFNWAHPEVSNVLFSPFHGLFYWHPLLFIGAIGFTLQMAQRRGLLLAAFAASLATVYINAAWWCWWFAGSFGSRAFEAVLLFFMGGLAMLLSRFTRTWRRIVFTGAVTACFWNVYIMALYYAALIERNAPVTWATMVRAGIKALAEFGHPGDP